MASRLGHRGVMFAVGGSDANPSFEHGGEDEGFVSDLVAYERGDGIVIMTNGGRGYELAQEIVRSAAHEYGWPDFRPFPHRIVPTAPSELSRDEGCYELMEGANMTVTRVADHLTVEMPGETPVDVFPEGTNRFFAKTID